MRLALLYSAFPNMGELLPVFRKKKVDSSRNRGILNQEAQTVDSEGRVHVLNRENTTGIEQW